MKRHVELALLGGVDGSVELAHALVEPGVHLALERRELAGQPHVRDVTHRLEARAHPHVPVRVDSTRERDVARGVCRWLHAPGARDAHALDGHVLVPREQDVKVARARNLAGLVLGRALERGQHLAHRERTQVLGALPHVHVARYGTGDALPEAVSQRHDHER